MRFQRLKHSLWFSKAFDGGLVDLQNRISESNVGFDSFTQENERKVDRVVDRQKRGREALQRTVCDLRKIKLNLVAVLDDASLAKGDRTIIGKHKGRQELVVLLTGGCDVPAQFVLLTVLESIEGRLGDIVQNKEDFGRLQEYEQEAS